MKRLLSWIVLVALGYVFNICQNLIWRVFISLATWLYSASTVFFWIIVVLVGSGILWLLLALICGAAGFIVRISQNIWRSKKGARYIVYGIFEIAGYALLIFFLIKGILETHASLEYFISYATMIVFGIMIIVTGVGTVASDGAPPTKVEQLEAKLAKEKAKAEAQSK